MWTMPLRYMNWRISKPVKGVPSALLVNAFERFPFILPFPPVFVWSNEQWFPSHLCNNFRRRNASTHSLGMQKYTAGGTFLPCSTCKEGIEGGVLAVMSQCLQMGRSPLWALQKKNNPTSITHWMFVFFCSWSSALVLIIFCQRVVPNSTLLSHVALFGGA